MPADVAVLERAVRAIIVELDRQAQQGGNPVEHNATHARVDGAFELTPLAWAILREVADAAQLALLDYEAANKDVAERVRYQHDYALAIFKALILVNGGAVIALFTLVGNTGARFDHRSIWLAFVAFATGIGATIVAHIGAYFSQGSFMYVSGHNRTAAQYRLIGRDDAHDTASTMKWGHVALYMAVALAIMATVCFALGSFFALRGALSG